MLNVDARTHEGASGRDEITSPLDADTIADCLGPRRFESALQPHQLPSRETDLHESVDFCPRNNSTTMLVVGDGILSFFVIQARFRFPSSSGAGVAIAKNGGRCCTKGVRRRIDVDIKCTAQQEVVIPTAKRKLNVRVVTEGERSGDDESVLPPNSRAAGMSAVCFDSAAHQLEISLHDLRLLSTQLELLSKNGGDDEIVDGIGPSGEEDDISEERSTDVLLPQLRPKKIWRGVRRRRRMLPQPPWRADDFTRRANLMLESILSEASSDRLLVEDVLNSWLGKVTRVELTRLMKDLGFLRQPSVALEVFFWMQKQKGRLKPSAHVHSAIIGMLGRAGMVSEAREIFDSQEVKSLQSVHIYNSMMGAYLKRGNFKRAWELYEDLCNRGLAADEITFNTLLSGISRADRPLKTAEKLLSRMKLTGIPPGRYTYNTLITVFSKCGHLEGAAALIEEMRAAKQTPDLCTYNTVIGMYGRAGKYEEALQVYEILRAAGFYPDVVTYTHLMQMFSQAKNLEAAIGQFSEMQRVGCMPDFITYSLVVHMYGSAGLAAEAEQAFKRMQEAGFKPNTVTWSSLIQAYGKKGMLEKVSSCFAEMLKSGCQPDVSLFHIMITAYRQAELPIHAASLFRRMQSQGIEPNAACFNTLIHAFFESGQREDAKAWHEQMVRSGFAPDKLSRRLLNNLSSGRRKCRDPRPSERLHSIQLVGLPPDFSK